MSPAPILYAAAGRSKLLSPLPFKPAPTHPLPVPATRVPYRASAQVNVFLGLGLPWSIGAIFWHMNGATDEWRARYPDLAPLHPAGGFVVPAGDLGFSVSVFTSCALLVLLTMTLRRKLLGAELGGPPALKRLTALFFVLLWLAYLAPSIWKSLSSQR